MDKYSRTYPDTKDFHYTKHARHIHINLDWKAVLVLMVGTALLVVVAYLSIRPVS
jgi:hypothetical protein